MPLEQALPPFTSNPARLLRLAGKGGIAAGADADLVALDATAAARDASSSAVPGARARRRDRPPRHFRILAGDEEQSTDAE